jgi:DNA gyrase inhibitor GyrI
MITGLTLRDQPVIERYINYAPGAGPDDLVTEIYVPVE